MTAKTGEYVLADAWMAAPARKRAASTNYKRLSREEYEVLLDQAPIMIWRANSNGDCDYFNQRWLQFRGLTKEQECVTLWSAGIHPSDLSRCLAVYRDAFGKRQPFEMEYRLQHNRDCRWVLDEGVPYFSRDREFLGYIGRCIDVTNRVATQRALEQAQARDLADLRGILSICMNCKKIRNVDGQWVQLEKYIRDHSRADFSHGLCAECYDTSSKQAAAVLGKAACGQVAGTRESIL